ncbi:MULTISPECIES: SDR family NAD(P)-dependent oxidoreductase [Cupriavidus]|uniref:NAD-dependent epimerase/dehydratase:Short-chain dehydrogenase/reductase SDR n=1 Tax=Cupriavidus pinatubonensis (strain JMP 134 / LMG 1197) TaxID=264198 RepID=Q471G7_CUPPJ|nr:MULTISPECIES: glucose 1-dehydrogenase [Cupriavidus]QYY33148.1 SDR family oxidoreductase [Cupriavidus pinatubonensis]TPQ39241.1 SDR family oxidoreductase [Cupriavidus pinatubonensis]
MSHPVVLITGATAGIGRATALAFAAKGARLVCSGRNATAGDALVSELRQMGAEADFLAADISLEGDVIRLVRHAIERFGSLDIAVNSAGTEGTPGSIVEQTVESYTTTFNANVLGTFLCMKHELQAMISQKRGSIVNLSSTMGSRGNPRNPMYVASKHAVEGLTKSAALDAIQSNVRVNAVAPGPIETGMLERIAGGTDRVASVAATIPAGRVGTPEEVADAILFLASEQATYITGQILHVNGGKTAA